MGLSVIPIIVSALGPFAKGYEWKLAELEIRRIEFIQTATFLKYLDLAKN